MRVRLSGILVAAVLSLAPHYVRAGLEAPHDKSDSNTSCYYCHTLSTITPLGSQDFSQACLSCHSRPGNGFGMPWVATDEAVPGTTGNSHSWSKPAVSPQYGADTVNIPFPQSGKLVDGKLQCALCHDPHRTSVAVKPESMHASVPLGVGGLKTGTFGADTGTALMTLSATPGAVARGFRLRLRTVTGGGGTFIISHDYGFNPDSWLNWVSNAWVSGTATGPGRPFSNGVDVPLDTAGASVRWTAGAAEGDYWDFYIGYPLLRLSNVSDSACITCHRERLMNHVRVRGTDRSYLPNGVRKFSHPVGVGLNANGFGLDRAVILDADGTAGSSTTDGQGSVANPTNDLVLDAGVVRCTTCHRVHNADSNSLTVDAR